MVQQFLRIWTNRLKSYGLLRFICISIFSWSSAISAQAGEDTLVKIAQTGRIVLGVQDTAMPLSYLDASGAHVGYHLDVCLRLVAAIQQRFELPKLKVITVPTSLTTRFALLDNRTIDIECGNNAINSSSMQQALLTHATMVSEIRLMTVAANKDWTIANLAGKSVGIEAGSPATPALRSLSRNSVPKIKETFGRMTGDTFALLEAGRVDAVALPTPSMLAQRALSADPSHYVLIDGVLRTDPVALMFRLQDESLQALANDVIDSMMRTGEMARLYDKWFMRPIPGLTEPVGIPLPPMLRALFDAPGSEMRGI